MRFGGLDFICWRSAQDRLRSGSGHLDEWAESGSLNYGGKVMFDRGRNIVIWVVIGVAAGAVVGAITGGIGGWIISGAIIGAAVGALIPKLRP